MNRVHMITNSDVPPLQHDAARHITTKYGRSVTFPTAQGRMHRVGLASFKARRPEKTGTYAFDASRRSAPQGARLA